jgi:hypothetical protein
LLFAGLIHRTQHDADDLLSRGRPNLEALEWLAGGVVGALETLRRGDPERAAQRARTTRSVARAANAEWVALAASAVRVEALVAAGRFDEADRELRALTAGHTPGVAGLLLLRARAALGDEAAAVELSTAGAGLAMPGLGQL